MAKVFSISSRDIAIDLGTANTLVYERNKGIVLDEPSVVALITDELGKQIPCAFGKEAKTMLGRTPAKIRAIRPMKDGVIADFRVAGEMIKYFIKESTKSKSWFGPLIIICVPSGSTPVERKAIQESAESAGAREVFLIEEPMAAAIGANLPVMEATGSMVVDIGGGTTEVAVISLGGIVLAKSLRIAGDKLNNDIISFIQDEYKLLIGERTAEEAKIKIGSAYPLKEKQELPLRGRNLITGLPEEILVSDEDIRRALSKSIRQILTAIKTTVEETPPELLADIMAKGIYLAGGGSQLKGLDILIQEEIKMPVKIIEDPVTAVVRGAGMVLENIDDLHDVLAESEEIKMPR